MAGKGGGAWKVAYADFVTAMMAFFLVMWIVAQSEQMKEAIANHFNDPFAKESDEDGTVNQRPPRHPAPARTSDQPEHEKEAGGSHSVLLTTQGGERTSIGTIVHFADDSAEMDAEAQRRLKEIAPLLIGKPQKIEVRGHSSRRPLVAGGPFTDHWHLSYQRCQAVMAELEKLGIGHERLRLSQAAGFEPLASPDEQLSGGGYARVEVSLLNETTGAKVAQNGVGPKSKLKVTDAHHKPDHGSVDHGHDSKHQELKNQEPKNQESKQQAGKDGHERDEKHPPKAKELKTGDAKGGH
jgi:chemotaxis protein MotB